MFGYVCWINILEVLMVGSWNFNGESIGILLECWWYGCNVENGIVMKVVCFVLISFNLGILLCYDGNGIVEGLMDVDWKVLL